MDDEQSSLRTLGSDIDQENALRDEMFREAKSPHVRPVSFYGNNRSFYQFLWDDVRGRYYMAQ